MKCKEGNLVICTAKKRPENLLDKIKATAWKKGFGTIKVVEFKDEKDSKEQNLTFKDPTRTKTCTSFLEPAE